MSGQEKVNILLVDDQPAKLLSYEVILKELGENLIKASSGTEALEHLLKSEVAVVLLDVCMPDLDGFQLASMIREHPRFEKTAMIFISAVQVTDLDRLKGYEMGAVDYVPVPVVPEVLRAKVKVFAELYRKTRQLEKLNAELEQRVVARTAELEASNSRLLQSEQRRSLALAASNMGSWDWDVLNAEWVWDEGQHRIFGVSPGTFSVTPENVRALVHSEDWDRLGGAMNQMLKEGGTLESEFRIRRPNGETRWCAGTATASLDANNRITRISGVTVDITGRKEAEERQDLLAREVDHRAKNALALVQSIVKLTRAGSIDAYVAAVEGRIKALSRVHTVLSQSRWQGADLRGLVEEELAPYRTSAADKIMSGGPEVTLQPATAQTLALALHELATNAAKYGALSALPGRVALTWKLKPDSLELEWTETGGPDAPQPLSLGFGTRIVIASIERQLGGRTQFDWRPEGLHCVLSIPRDKMESSEREAGRRAADPAADTPFAVPGDRVMIVEDEALVAMVMAESLADLGYAVVGPYSRAPAALAALNENGIDAAILDVNLNGEMVYPVADALVALNVPFVFVTGYGTESIERRFSNVPILQKPIDRLTLQRLFVPKSPGARVRRSRNGKLKRAL